MCSFPQLSSPKDSSGLIPPTFFSQLPPPIFQYRIMDSDNEERLQSSEVEGKNALKGRIWEESKKTLRIAFPTMLFRVASFGMAVVTQLFVGHFGQIELAAYALIQTILVLFVSGVLQGMSSATETLCGQAFGAKQYHTMGIYLQRTWIVNLIAAKIMLPLFIFATPIFRLLGQAEEISTVAGKISVWFIPYVYYLLFSRTIQRYLQAQLKNMVIGWLSAFSFVFHVLLSWIFVSKLKLGIPGAMSALNISSWLVVISQFVYVLGGWCPETWKGFTTAAFANLLPVIKLSISSGVMLCLELWYGAIILLLAGYLKNATVAIAAFSICLNISAWALMFFLGFLGAVCVRVSNELGKGNARAAKFAIKVSSSISICIGVLFWILCFVFGQNFSYLFTSNKEVAETVSSLSVLLAFSVLLNSVQTVLTGVAVGAGWQGVVAFVNVGCLYILGIPLGVLLAYVAHLSVRGMWIGMLFGVAMQSLVLFYLTWRTNWDEQVRKTAKHLNKWSLKPPEEPNQNPPQA
ncbi:protein DETOXIFICATION 24-like isoform X1 [Vitis riparia]|uniref:protein DETOXIFICATION 24-like isoform X1 n=1 Tax=Vitis riparia TaxID=96939 RepID=UPI00155A2631|nr:protein DETOXIFICATION 24-like isoform X1 [Vitis riparia]